MGCPASFETADVRHFSPLIALVWYVHEGTIKRISLSLKNWSNHQSKRCVSLCERRLCKHKLAIQIIGSMCTDCAPAMLGSKSWISALIKQVIKRYSLFTSPTSFGIKNLPPKSKKVVDITVMTIKQITGRALNPSPLLVTLWRSWKWAYSFSKVGWLARGRDLTVFLSLREQIKVFLE